MGENVSRKGEGNVRSFFVLLVLVLGLSLSVACGGGGSEPLPDSERVVLGEMFTSSG